jgi:hypothetical protein
MIQRLSQEKDPPSVQRDRARRHALATCDSARQVLLLSNTVQRLGGRAFSVDARIDAAVERVMGGERFDPTRAGKAARRLSLAHTAAAAALAQLQELLETAPADALLALTEQLSAALSRVEEAIEERA